MTTSLRLRRMAGFSGPVADSFRRLRGHQLSAAGAILFGLSAIFIIYRFMQETALKPKHRGHCSSKLLALTPLTSFAVSITNRSFARVASTAMSLPCTVLENPHCSHRKSAAWLASGSSLSAYCPHSLGAANIENPRAECPSRGAIYRPRA